MAEQFLKGYGVDIAELQSVVGSHDEDILKKTKRRRNLYEEVGELLEEWGDGLSVETVLGEIINAKLVPRHAYEYRRVLQLVAETIAGGSLKPDEITLPGRGWHELGPALSHWKLKRLGAKFKDMTPWPWPRIVKGAWPVALVIKRSELKAYEEELAAFDPKLIGTKGVPKGVDRFDQWEAEDLSAEVKQLIAGLRKWVAKAAAQKTDLLVWIDGQQ
jgi:hypothetical protein